MHDKDSINKEEGLLTKIENECPIEINEVKEPKYASLFQIILLGVLFLFCRSTILSYSNMISQIYKQQGYTYLGTISVISIWVAFGFNSLITSRNILQKISLKTGLVLCSMNFPLVTSTGIYASACEENSEGWCSAGLVYFVVILASLICGGLGSVLWMSQAGYILCAAPPQKLALYIGWFFALNQSSQITANLLTLVVLENVTQFQYFIILFSIAIFFSLSFLILPSVEKKEQKKFTIKENYQKIRELLKNDRIKCLTVFFMTTGVCIGFYSAYLYLLVEKSLQSGLTKSEVNVKTSYVFILLGISSFFAGLFCGKIAGKVSIFSLMIFSIVLLEISLIFSMLTYFTRNYALCFVTGGLWGFADSFITTLSNILVRTEIGNGLEGYAILRFCMGIGVLITAVLSIVLSAYSNIAFLLIMFFLQMLAMVVVMEMQKINK